MRKMTYKGKVSYLTERECKSLLARFNGKNAKPSSGGRGYTIDKNCVLCDRYYDVDKWYSCKSCPMSVFEVSCYTVMSDISRGLLDPTESVSRYEVRWEVGDEDTPKGVEFIRRALLILPRVKGRG